MCFDGGTSKGAAGARTQSPIVKNDQLVGSMAAGRALDVRRGKRDGRRGRRKRLAGDGEDNGECILECCAG